MEIFFTEHWQIVIGFISSLLIILGYFIRQMFSSARKQENKMEDRIKALEEEADEIKKNYLARFEEVMEKLNEIAITVASIETSVVAQEKFCKYIQEQKK